jgi:protein TonB
MRSRAGPALAVAAFLASCRSPSDGTVTLPAEQAASPDRPDDSPVPLNLDSPIDYPAALVQQRIGGTVILRLFVTEEGAVVAESTRIQESSGYPALDSAALAAAPRLQYAPALREGRPVAGPFLQPFNFRAPPGGGASP